MDKLYPFVACKPEEVGLRSQDIEKYYSLIEEKGVNLHGLMIIRHGKVAAEGYWAPFDAEYMHRMYSCSKTFTSTAIGILQGDGKLNIHDPLVKYFPEYEKYCSHPYKAQMTIRDLLLMATPYAVGSYEFTDKNWVESFFNKLEPTHPAGTIWHYDTSGTHTLAALVERVSGQKLLDFLYDRVFKYMGGSDDMWCIKAPEGTSWGGAGVIARQRDLARLGYLWLNYGRFNGMQLIPEDYVREGSSFQIENCLLGINNRNHKCGYGYQVWMERYNGFSFWGMATQYCVCFRDKDLMLVCTGNTIFESIDEEYVFNLFIENVYKNMSDEPIAENKADYESLQKKLSSLTLQLPGGEKDSPCRKNINGKEYEIIPNRMDISKIRFEFSEDGRRGKFFYTNASGDKVIEFGTDTYVEGRFPQKGYNYDVMGVPSDHLYRSLNAAGWVMENTLMLNALIEDIHCGLVTMKFNFSADGNRVALMFCKSGENILNEYYGNASGTAKK